MLTLSKKESEGDMRMNVNIHIPKFNQSRVRGLLKKIHNDLFKIDEHIILTESDLSLVEHYVIVLEDRRFFLHSGFDLKSFIRELIKSITTLRFKGGASTIDMQFVRTVTGYRARTLKRKIYEIFLAFIINNRYSKRVILHSYMCHAYLGTGLTGIEQAARKTFKKDISSLTELESAMVASMLLTPQPLLQTSRWYVRTKRRATYAISVREAKK